MDTMTPRDVVLARLEDQLGWYDAKSTASQRMYKLLTFTATVTKMLWVNPHAWIYVDVKKSDGTVEEWMIEAGTPNTLLRRGFTRESLEVGTQIVVDGYQSKDGSRRAGIPGRRQNRGR